MQTELSLDFWFKVYKRFKIESQKKYIVPPPLRAKVPPEFIGDLSLYGKALCL